MNEVQARDLLVLARRLVRKIDLGIAAPVDELRELIQTIDRTEHKEPPA